MRGGRYTSVHRPPSSKLRRTQLPDEHSRPRDCWKGDQPHVGVPGPVGDEEQEPASQNTELVAGVVRAAHGTSSLTRSGFESVGQEGEIGSSESSSDQNGCTEETEAVREDDEDDNSQAEGDQARVEISEACPRVIPLLLHSIIQPPSYGQPTQEDASRVQDVEHPQHAVSDVVFLCVERDVRRDGSMYKRNPDHADGDEPNALILLEQVTPLELLPRPRRFCWHPHQQDAEETEHGANGNADSPKGC